MMQSLLSAATGIIVAQALWGAPQELNINGAGELRDTRPFGKYLVQICTLKPWNPDPGLMPVFAPESLDCTAPPIPVPHRYPPPPASYKAARPSQPTGQTITLKLVGCPPGGGPCDDPAYPIAPGSSFLISATSDSGLPVTQAVLSGNVTPSGGTGLIRYNVNGPGTIVIQGTQIGDGNYAPAPLVELILAVQASGGDASCKGLLPPSPVSTAPQLDLATIAGVLGNPTPFTLATQGKNTILIYSSRYPLRVDEEKILQTIPANIADLASRTQDSLGGPPTKPFKVELQIPHAGALGDLASRISGLNSSQFTVQNIGSDRVRIGATSQPDCDTWTAFLKDVRSLEWQPSPESFEMRLYYLSAGDVATAFNTLTANGGSTGGSGLGSGSSGGSGSGVSGGSGGSGGGSAGGSGGGGSTGSGAGSGASSGGAGNSIISVTQPPGSMVAIRSDTTPCVIAGLEFGNANGCAPASGSGGSSGGSSGASGSSSSGGGAAAAKPPSMAPVGLPPTNGPQIVSDLMVFSDATPGDDAQVTERKRVLALLDLPRPEMLVNAWVTQNSTSNPSAVGAFANTVRELVNRYNDTIEEVQLKGWKYVSERTHHPEYFDAHFYHYIADRFVADAASTTPAKSIQEAAQNYLNSAQGKITDTVEARTRKFGICAPGQYCLGYNRLFQPLKPRLTDFLLTLIAAANPEPETLQAIAKVEGPVKPVSNQSQCKAPEVGGRERHERCIAIWTNLGLDLQPPTPENGCIADDYGRILGSLANPDPAGENNRRMPRVFLRCFDEAVHKYMGEAGLLRAALANFLFHYKLSQMYPHEFDPYELSQSADELNTAFSPLIDAFNRDIVAYQTFMRADVQYQVERLNNVTDRRCCAKRLFGLGKPYFFNDGLVTVRTISGQNTTVNTTSQSALNVSSAPTLSTLLNNIASPGGSGSSPLAATLGTSQAPASLLTGVLNSYQTTYAQIGRALNLSVLPRSLSTASSAEINVTLNADETAGGPIYSGGPQGGTQPNMSRVASHDTTTRIRVESVKLFEVSSFSAILQRSRSKFPLLPPFVEIPYLGTLAGIPIPGAKEYHTSIAVMSAMVVPTAADIAYGLSFATDLVVDSPQGACSIVKDSAGSGVSTCKYRAAVSLHDLSPHLDTFHRSLMHCFATNMLSPASSFGNLASTDTSACKSLSFDSAY